MEVGMCVRAVTTLPLSNPWKTHEDYGFLRASSFLSRTSGGHERRRRKEEIQRQGMLVVEAKGKRGGGMQSRQFQRQPPPPLPKVEEDGNPKFVIFIRTANVYLWYPLSLITGGTTAKIMVAAKDNFLGKYIYKDTIARNIAAVIYRDEKEIQKSALKQFRVLRSATAFRYGYKLVENGNVRAALSPSNVIELPPQEELKTVLDKVKDFFGEATSGVKESFGKLTAIDSIDQSSEAEPKSEVGFSTYVENILKCDECHPCVGKAWKVEGDKGSDSFWPNFGVPSVYRWYTDVGAEAKNRYFINTIRIVINGSYCFGIGVL